MWFRGWVEYEKHVRLILRERRVRGAGIDICSFTWKARTTYICYTRGIKMSRQTWIKSNEKRSEEWFRI
jgi:hypothetical protein